MPSEQTRAEHIAWCKERAKAEMNFSGHPKEGIISMMSDLRKHPETRDETLQALCMMELMRNPNMAQALNFIDGFN